MCPLFRPRTDHGYPQKPNPSRETVSLMLKNVFSFKKLKKYVILVQEVFFSMKPISVNTIC